jgi:EAL domain-containing protein (putative c-di-GMP-specific phosphodiesterase class I)
VQAVPGHASHETVARTIITLGRSLGLQVLAEGVEHPAQRDFLQQHGCQYFQGFLFSPALDIDTFERHEATGRHTPMDYCV